MRATVNYNSVARSAQSADAAHMRSKKIVFYGNFGSGNLGNECTLQVVVEQLRERWPDAELVCLCAIPEDVRSRHGIAAVRASVNESGWRWAARGRAPEPGAAAAPSMGTPARILSKVARLVLRRAPLELLQWLEGVRLLMHVDLLIIPGTQIVSDYLCGPAGWPYDIFKWSTLAALCRVRLAFLSIGVGPIRHPLSRWMILTSLRLASYRSYRDEESKHYARSIGLAAEHDPVYPDLVFGLSQRHLCAMGEPGPAPRVVGLGLKNYNGAADEATSLAERAYFETMADFVAWLEQRGYAVRLLIGDLQYDLEPRRAFCALLEQRGILAQSPLLLSDDPLTVGELIGQIAQTDFVISPRFHNLVLAMLQHKPVICLSDHVKLDSLFTRLGLTEYRMQLQNLTAATLIKGFEDLEREAARLRRHIEYEMQQSRRALEEQYAQLFSAACGAD